MVIYPLKHQKGEGEKQIGSLQEGFKYNQFNGFHLKRTEDESTDSCRREIEKNDRNKRLR